jgi:hypothetical protein
MTNPKFDFVFLGQSVLKYQVPLDIFIAINTIYETNFNNLYKANRQLVGKIENEHSLFYHGADQTKMKNHNLLSTNITSYFMDMFKHYLAFNKIRDYDLHLNSIWVNEMKYSASDTPQNGRLQILGAANGQFAKIDYQPPMNLRDFYIFPYDMRHCVYPFNGTDETRRTLAANCDVQFDPIKNRGAA